MELVEMSFVVLELSISVVDSRLIVEGERRVMSCWVNLCGGEYSGRI